MKLQTKGRIDFHSILPWGCAEGELFMAVHQGKKEDRSPILTILTQSFHDEREIEDERTM